jgi:hypothetical protein
MPYTAKASSMTISFPCFMVIHGLKWVEKAQWLPNCLTWWILSAFGKEFRAIGQNGQSTDAASSFLKMEKSDRISRWLFLHQ